MEKYFEILLLGELNERPPISHLVKEYFENFFLEKVLAEKGIIVGGKWKVSLAIHFQEKGPMATFEDMAFANGARTIASESIKMYSAVIHYNLIKDAEKPYLQTIELIYKVVKVFITSTYKKVKPTFIDELWNEIDLNYLFSLPYPASIEEQRYFLDEVMGKQV
ncbi:hypothetical protein LX64_02673 [Chitinophaga skermanii]|uniref:Uncharacterized protein n=1 Tax=Chitinophaga skermanii TaxID=331697 RepID=A0A327QQ87_9BACT|nr:hypothetical protein [Chitinophaga skermanii]RAJ05513.1 hypothetical protein LX64_02673 [Chitinophaga skermanii]